MKKSKLTLRCLCEAAIMIALAQILGYLKLYELPQGGSITLSMLPIFLFCSRWGFGPGMLASFAFSLLQLFLDGAYAWSWQSMLGDYIFAFTVLGFAGLFSKKRFGFFYGTLLGSALRFLVHYVVGGLGRVHAGDLLWHDDDLSVVLLRALQRLLHGARLRAGAAGRLDPVEADGQVHPRRRHQGAARRRQIRIIFAKPGRKAGFWFTFRAGIAILASVDKERESRNDHL